MGSPRDEVFTTVAVVNGEIEFLDLHLKRLKEHANRLDFEINIPDFQKFEDGLVRITFSGTWNFEHRPFPVYNPKIRAIYGEAPEFEHKVMGTKHGQWKPYRDAKLQANSEGAEVCLLVKNGLVIDADRASPILLDAQGIAWASDEKNGSVRSVTFEALIELFSKNGIPIQFGNITKKMIERCQELIVVGTGIRVATISHIHEQRIGSGTFRMFEICHDFLEVR